MKLQTFSSTVVLSSLLTLVVLPEWASAQQTRRGGSYGDWLVKIDFDGRQTESVLALSRDQEGNRTGQWISFWGASDLQDVQYLEGKLDFSWARTNRDGQTVTSKFTGTIEEGTLVGSLSSDRGEYRVEGKRSPRFSRAAGNWAMNLKVNEQVFASTLAISPDESGNLSGQWQSEWGEHEITDLAYERGNLSFGRRSKIQDREWESTFQGTIERDVLSGTIKSELGEIEVTGEKLGAPLIGTWNLEVASERGSRKQRLRVNPDMSGLYGSLQIEKILLEDDQVSFSTVLQFGDQEFELSFAGKVGESVISGELTTSRGSQKVTGTKVIRTFRRQNTN